MRILVASPTESISAASVQNLPTGKLLIVVDDAHDREDLQPVFALAATRREEVTLLIAARLYGAERIAEAATAASDSSRWLKVIPINRLSFEESESLAKKALDVAGGNREWSEPLAQLTLDCPLATVLGAKIVAREKLHPLFAQNEQQFRSVLLGKFREWASDHLFRAEERATAQKLLGFLALVQPVSIDDKPLWSAFASVSAQPEGEVMRMLRRLVDGGLLYQRGGRYRIAPDLLGDHLIETSFVGAGGYATPEPGAYFDQVPAAYLPNILTNVGRMDWRLASNGQSRPRLLDELWSRLKPTGTYGDHHTEAVKAVAYFQPEKAIEFVAAEIRIGRRSRQLSDILRSAAYNADHTEAALALLWELGRNDQKEPRSEPSHPIRVMHELAEFQPGRPLAFNEMILDFGLRLMGRDEAWSNHNTPLDFLDSLLDTEGHTTSYRQFMVSFRPFPIDPDVVRPIRRRLIEAIVETTFNADERRGVKAAKAFANACRGPMGMFGMEVGQKLLDRWQSEFVWALELLKDQLSERLPSVGVKVALQGSVRWHARYGKDATKNLAREILLLLGSDLDTRFTELLLNGYGSFRKSESLEEGEGAWNRFKQMTYDDLIAAYPRSADLLDYISTKYSKMSANGALKTGSPEVPILDLLAAVPGLAGDLAGRTLKEPSHSLARYTGSALGHVLRADHATAHEMFEAFIAAENAEFMIYVGQAYQLQRYDRERLEQADLALLRKLLASEHAGVVEAAARATRFMISDGEMKGVALALEANVISEASADAIAAGLLSGPDRKPIRLNEDQVSNLLDKFVKLPTLTPYQLEHWLSHVSAQYPEAVTDFLIARVEHAISDEDEREFRALNHGPYCHYPLKVKASGAALHLMQRVYNWAREHDSASWKFRYEAANLFEVLFGPFDETTVAFFRERLRQADSRDFRILAYLLREADREFVLRFPAFVHGILEQAGTWSAEVQRELSGELFASALSGMKSGTAGEPFPEDMVLRDKSSEISKAYRGSPQLSIFTANSRPRLSTTSRERSAAMRKRADLMVWTASAPA